MSAKKSAKLIKALVFATALCMALSVSPLFAGVISAQADQSGICFARRHGGGHHNYYNYGHGYCG